VLADIYAAGTILYEMLTGTTPFCGHISTILTRQLSEPVQPPSERAPHRGISRTVDRVVLRALEPSPTTRFQSVRELAVALAAAFDQRLDEPELLLAIGSDYWVEAPTMQRPRHPAMHHSTELLADRIQSIISAALTRAQQQIDERKLPAAIEELEATLASLSPQMGADVPPSPAVWRIETVLAALYVSIGKQERARRMALVAYRHALQTGCALAESRAGTLVDRLVARSHRTARGSSRPR
jgi:serine/threonine protein kinase